MTNNTTAPERIWAMCSAFSNWDEPIATQHKVDHFVKYVRADALEAAQARIAELEGAAVSIRSQAIRDFCEAAGIKASVQVKHLPEDVRRFRAQAAFDQKTARATLQEGKG